MILSLSLFLFFGKFLLQKSQSFVSRLIVSIVMKHSRFISQGRRKESTVTRFNTRKTADHYRYTRCRLREISFKCELRGLD